jgi:hypothetical protein
MVYGSISLKRWTFVCWGIKFILLVELRLGGLWFLKKVKKRGFLGGQNGQPRVLGGPSSFKLGGKRFLVPYTGGFSYRGIDWRRFRLIKKFFGGYFRGFLSEFFKNFQNQKKIFLIWRFRLFWGFRPWKTWKKRFWVVLNRIWPTFGGFTPSWSQGYKKAGVPLYSKSRRKFIYVSISSKI